MHSLQVSHGLASTRITDSRRSPDSCSDAGSKSINFRKRTNEDRRSNTLTEGTEARIRTESAGAAAHALTVGWLNQMVRVMVSDGGRRDRTAMIQRRLIDRREREVEVSAAARPFLTRVQTDARRSQQKTGHVSLDDLQAISDQWPEGRKGPADRRRLRETG